jgi:hypothetical protein
MRCSDSRCASVLLGTGEELLFVFADVPFVDTRHELGYAMVGGLQRREVRSAGLLYELNVMYVETI